MAHLEFPTEKEFAEKVANRALDEITYKGYTLREWVKKLAEYEQEYNSKPRFRLEDYLGNYVMHCDTKEKAEKFCEFLDSQGRTWVSNESYTNHNWQSVYEEETCYYFNKGTYGVLSLAKVSNAVLEFDDFDWEE